MIFFLLYTSCINFAGLSLISICFGLYNYKQGGAGRFLPNFLLANCFGILALLCYAFAIKEMFFVDVAIAYVLFGFAFFVFLKKNYGSAKNRDS